MVKEKKFFPKRLQLWALVQIWTLGFLLCPIPLLQIKTLCEGAEVFPRFYSAPFIYKSSSLVTSLAFDYYWIGFLLNQVILSSLIFLALMLILKKMKNSERRRARTVFKVVLTMVSVFLITAALQTSSGSAVLNWMDLQNEAAIWGVSCESQMFLFEN
jgi:hypothetical protein